MAEDLAKYDPSEEEDSDDGVGNDKVFLTGSNGAGIPSTKWSHNRGGMSEPHAFDDPIGSMGHVKTNDRARFIASVLGASLCACPSRASSTAPAAPRPRCWVTGLM